MKKIIWFGLGGLLLVRKGFSKAARVAFSSDMLLKIKNSLFTWFHTKDTQLLNETLKIFLW